MLGIPIGCILKALGSESAVLKLRCKAFPGPVELNFDGSNFNSDHFGNFMVRKALLEA